MKPSALKKNSVFEDLLQKTVTRALFQEGPMCTMTAMRRWQLKMRKFKRRQDSEVHGLAEALCANKDYAAGLRRSLAPPTEQFKDVWEHIFKGGHSAAGVAGVGNRHAIGWPTASRSRFESPTGNISQPPSLWLGSQSQ